jgi:hypothetical protein
MAISNLHKLDAILFPDTSLITELRNQRWLAGIESIIERPAGHPHPMFRGNLAQKPLIEFSTPQLATLLALIGVGGAAFGQIDTWHKLANATSNSARNASAHMKISVESSFGHWTDIRLPHNGVGEASVQLTAIYDGTNEPFVYAGSETLSGNLTAPSWYGAGPVSLNGVAIIGVQEITISSGIRLIQAGGESELYDTFVGVEMTEPSVTIRTLSSINWAAIGLNGTALNGSTGLVCYARKFANTGRVANATAEHIKFTGLNGTCIPVDTNGDGSSPITDTLRIELISGSDSVLPLTINTASAIS